MDKIKPLERKNKKAKTQKTNAPVSKNSIYDVTIKDLSSDGNGVAKINDFTVFVPNCAIGDRLKVKIVKVLTRYAFGIIDKIVKPSKDRCENDCSVCGQCGGCCYRHISYEAELEIKQSQVQQVMQRIGGLNIEANKIIGSQQQNFYRNKGQFPVGYNKDGDIISGFYASHSHRIIPCDDCKLQPVLFNKIVTAVTDFCKTNAVSIYDEKQHKGVLRHVYLRQADQTKQLMLCLVSTTKEFPHIDKFISYITSQFKEITSIVLNVNTKLTNVILGEKCITVYGEDIITDVLCGNKIEISPLSFYQVNKPQAEILYKKATDLANLKSDDILLDLYCGAGTIGLSVANQVDRLIGVEIIPEAIENAKKNAELNSITNAEFICGDCKTAIKQLQEAGTKPTVIIVDPPRKGCDSEVIDTIVQLAPTRLVMISCNPATAARDCNLLEQQGFRVEEYTPVDLFPRTKHCECVCLLKRIEK